MVDVRKNLVIIIFLLTGAIVALLFLNLNSSRKKQQAEILDSYSVPVNLPKKTSKGVVNFFEASGSGKVVFYEESDSIVYETDLDGKNKKELARIPGILKIVFGPLGYELIATVSTGKNTLKNYYFDLKNGKRTELPKDAENIVFSSDGGKTAYYFYNDGTGEGNISIADPDGSDFKIIFKTRVKNLKILWPEDNLIVFYSKTEKNPPVFSISAGSGKLQRLTEEESFSYLDKKISGKEILEELGIEASKTKLSPFKDYLIFINAKDGKLYSLKL